MVSDHKIRQQLYHHLNPNPSDLNIDVPVIERTDTDLALHVIDYFTNSGHEIEYPAKSYAVAVIYAYLLEKYFNVPVDTSLKDPNLLFGNDPHYVPYQENPDVYDIAMRVLTIDCDGLPYYLPQVRATVDYFDQEFFITPNPYFDNANLHK